MCKAKKVTTNKNGEAMVDKLMYEDEEYSDFEARTCSLRMTLEDKKNPAHKIRQILPFTIYYFDDKETFNKLKKKPVSRRFFEAFLFNPKHVKIDSNHKGKFENHNINKNYFDRYLPFKTDSDEELVERFHYKYTLMGEQTMRFVLREDKYPLTKELKQYVKKNNITDLDEFIKIDNVTMPTDFVNKYIRYLQDDISGYLYERTTTDDLYVLDIYYQSYASYLEAKYIENNPKKMNKYLINLHTVERYYKENLFLREQLQELMRVNTIYCMTNFKDTLKYLNDDNKLYYVDDKHFTFDDYDKHVTELLWGSGDWYTNKNKYPEKENMTPDRSKELALKTQKEIGYNLAKEGNKFLTLFAYCDTRMKFKEALHSYDYVKRLPSLSIGASFGVKDNITKETTIFTSVVEAKTLFLHSEPYQPAAFPETSLYFKPEQQVYYDLVQNVLTNIYIGHEIENGVACDRYETQHNYTDEGVWLFSLVSEINKIKRDLPDNDIRKKIIVNFESTGAAIVELIERKKKMMREFAIDYDRHPELRIDFYGYERYHTDKKYKALIDKINGEFVEFREQYHKKRNIDYDKIVNDE